ncbi:hypothetical protein AgCh_030505 [Apium graveolens]
MDCGGCLRVFQSDFGFGFLGFRQFLLGVVLYGFFGLGFKFLEGGWQCWGFGQWFCVLGGVWSELRSGVFSKSCFDGGSGIKVSSCEVEGEFLIGNVDGNRECGDERDDGNGGTLEGDFDVISGLKVSSCELDDRFLIENVVDERDDENGGTLEIDSKFSSCEFEDLFLIEKVDGIEECGDERDDECGCTLECDVDGETDIKLFTCKCGILGDRLMIEKCDEDEECVDEVDDGYECYDVDKECDVVKLRELVKVERERANAANVELEKERMAAATAAEETMAMILRLQKEKSVIEMEAHQYRRLAEEKQLHDQEVIESLRWIAMRCQSAGLQLEDQVRSLKQKVELQLKDDEGAQSVGVDKSFSFYNYNFEDNTLEDKFFSFHNFNFEDDLIDDRLVSSLDLALSSW